MIFILFCCEIYIWQDLWYRKYNWIHFYKVNLHITARKKEATAWKPCIHSFPVMDHPPLRDSPLSWLSWYVLFCVFHYSFTTQVSIAKYYFFSCFLNFIWEHKISWSSWCFLVLFMVPGLLLSYYFNAT